MIVFILGKQYPTFSLKKKKGFNLHYPACSQIRRFVVGLFIPRLRFAHRKKAHNNY